MTNNTRRSTPASWSPEYPKTHPRGWDCGYCMARAGEPCTPLAGVHAVKDHADRRESARLFTRYGTGMGIGA